MGGEGRGGEERGGEERRGEGWGGEGRGGEGAWCAKVSMLNGVELFFSTHTAILCLSQTAFCDSRRPSQLTVSPLVTVR